MAQERERENKIERKEFMTRKRERKVWMEKKWKWCLRIQGRHVTRMGIKDAEKQNE